jgi:S-ribosylhomocysteine lyase
MIKIESFKVDHTRLKRGLYVSRVDRFGSTIITSFDLRMKEPNREPVLGNRPLHTIEHLGATYLRSHPEWGSRTAYFGPMGCRTGFYALLEGEHRAEDALPLFMGLFEWILAYSGEVPGASPSECGNWAEQDLAAAKDESARYLAVLRAAGPENLNYPA